jgi:Ca-activated chloride channel homolog
MTYDHPWALLLLLPVLAWTAWEWRTSSRRGALLLKAGALAAVAAALSMPRLNVYETKMAVGLLADTSASMSPQDLAAESVLADRMDSGRGRHWMRVIPFARTTRNTAIDERVKGKWQLRHTAAPAGHGTDMEGAIRDGMASLPAGMVPRLVLVSDGHENAGSVASAIWQAQQLGVPIDTVPLPGRPKPGLLLDSISIPGQVFSGERFADRKSVV